MYNVLSLQMLPLVGVAAVCPQSLQSCDSEMSCISGTSCISNLSGARTQIVG